MTSLGGAHHVRLVLPPEVPSVFGYVHGAQDELFVLKRTKERGVLTAPSLSAVYRAAGVVVPERKGQVMIDDQSWLVLNTYVSGCHKSASTDDVLELLSRLTEIHAASPMTQVPPVSAPARLRLIKRRLRVLPTGVRDVIFSEILGLHSACTCRARPGRLVHGDLRGSNLVWGEFGSPAVIDFEDSRSGAGEEDIAAVLLLRDASEYQGLLEVLNVQCAPASLYCRAAVVTASIDRIVRNMPAQPSESETERLLAVSGTHRRS